MTESFTYKDAGVDIHEAAALVGDIGELRRRTERKRQLMQAFGLFAACYDLSGYKEPVIVTGATGSAPSCELLLEHDELEIAGKDLVAMNVNDILTTGGDPLMFLDYIGIGKIDEQQIKRLIAGMVDYLRGLRLHPGGGETAEMPGSVEPGMIELSGFCVGCGGEGGADRSCRGWRRVTCLVGYASDGFHANGWSLVRRILASLPGGAVGTEMHELLAPTRLYYDVVTELRKTGVRPKAMAHITGGGLPENLERLFGGHGAADRDPGLGERGGGRRSWRTSRRQEAVNTFNMGFGWVAIVSPDEVDATTAGRCVAGVVIGGSLELD